MDGWSRAHRIDAASHPCSSRAHPIGTASSDRLTPVTPRLPIYLDGPPLLQRPQEVRRIGTMELPQVVVPLEDGNLPKHIRLEPSPLVITQPKALQSLLCEILHPTAHWTGSLDVDAIAGSVQHSLAEYSDCSVASSADVRPSLERRHSSGLLGRRGGSFFYKTKGGKGSGKTITLPDIPSERIAESAARTHSSEGSSPNQRSDSPRTPVPYKALALFANQQGGK